MYIINDIVCRISLYCIFELIKRSKGEMLKCKSHFRTNKHKFTQFNDLSNIEWLILNRKFYKESYYKFIYTS